MTNALIFLIVLSIIAVIVAILIGTRSSSSEETTEPESDIGENGTGLGAPLFLNNEGRKQLAYDLNVNDMVWALTPFGPQNFRVTMVVDADPRCVNLQNADFVGQACFEGDYFSPEMATRYGGHTGVWRIGFVERIIGSNAFDHYSDRDKRANRDWLREESMFGDDDMLDALLFYYFIFDGFHEPFDYYDNYEMPAYEFPDDRPPIDERIFDDVTADPTPAPEPEPAPIPEPEPEPILTQPIVEDVPDEAPAEVTDESFDFEDDTKRDTYIPDPDPPSYDDGGSSYDDGGGWDSGGGFDD